MASTNGSGSIVQLEKDKPRGKCRKWQLRVSLGKSPKTGKYVTRTKRVTGTYTDAKQALRDFIAELEKGKQLAPAHMTFMGYCERYLHARAVAQNTTNANLLNIERLLKNASLHFGYADIAAVDADMVTDALYKMSLGESVSGKPLSGTTLHGIHGALSMVFAAATKEGVVKENPMGEVPIPKRDTKKRKSLRPEQVAELIATLDAGDEHECAYLLALTLGLRAEEVAGLSWGDVSFERRSIAIVYANTAADGFKETKTSSGRRLLPMSDLVRDILLKHRDSQMKRLRVDALTDESPVILNHKGVRAVAYQVSKWWNRAKVSLGHPEIRFHDLRHTYLSMLALCDVHPKVMQELAGHASAQITMDIYTHTQLEAKVGAAQAFDALVAAQDEALQLPPATAA